MKKKVDFVELTERWRPHFIKILKIMQLTIAVFDDRGVSVEVCVFTDQIIKRMI